MDLFATVKETFPGVPDDQAQRVASQIQQQIEASGQQVDENTVKQAFQQVAPAVVQKMAARPVQQPMVPQAPAKPAYDATAAYNQANDRYTSALDEIKKARAIGGLGAALTSRFNPQRVAENNAKYDAEASAAKDATLGDFATRNKLQGEQETRDWNTQLHGREETKWGREDQKYGREQSEQADADDPDSDTSKAAREAMKAQAKLYPNLNLQNIDGMSKSQIDKVYPMFKSTVDMYVKHQEHEDTIAQRRQAASDAAAQRQLTREQTAALAADKVQAKADEKTKEQKAKDETVLDTITQGLSIIQKLRQHPGKSAAVGQSIQKHIPFYPEKGAEGSDMRDFNELNDQLKAQSFLSSIQKMKGMGALSNIEGEKAQAALAQLSTHQSEAQYNEALDSLESILSAAQAKLQNGGVVPSAPTTKKKVYNPTTGKIE